MENSKTTALPDGLEVFTLAARPDLQTRARSLDPAVLPRFITQDAMVGRYWNELYTRFADFQIAVCDGDEVVAAGNCIPISWDETVEGLPVEGLTTDRTKLTMNDNEVIEGYVTSLDGTRIGFLRQGNGPGLVLVQGAMGTAQDYRELAQALSANFTVYTPDRRGRGMSAKPYDRWHDIARDVEDVDAILVETTLSQRVA